MIIAVVVIVDIADEIIESHNDISFIRAVCDTLDTNSLCNSSSLCVKSITHDSWRIAVLVEVGETGFSFCISTSMSSTGHGEYIFAIKVYCKSHWHWGLVIWHHSWHMTQHLNPSPCNTIASVFVSLLDAIFVCLQPLFLYPKWQSLHFAWSLSADFVLV